MRGKIRVFNVLFDDRFGGPSKRVLLVDGALRSLGVATTLVLPEGQGNAGSLAAQAGMPVLRLAFTKIPRPSMWLRVLRWVLRLPWDIGRFYRLFRRHRPDIAHVNGAFFVAPAFACRLAGVSLVWHLNDVIVPRSLAPAFGLLVRLTAHEVVVSSLAVGDHYRVARERSRLLYPPVDLSRVRPRQEIAEGQGPPELLRIGLIANWNPIKGVEHFVSGAARVRDELGDRLRLVLAGARLDNHQEYTRKIEDLIDRLGLRPLVVDHGFQPEVSQVLEELDLVVMSSTSEAVSMAALEGMAAGVPVVASDVGGVRELLLGDPEHPAGAVVPPADPEALAAAILELVRDWPKARAMGREGRRRAEASFSRQMVAQRHLEVYSDALREGVEPLGSPTRTV